MCELSGDERAEVFRRTWHRAGKQHVCECCGSAIPAGHRYESTFIVFDGNPDSAKTCRPCAHAIDKFGRAHGFWPWPSSFSDYLSECIDEDDDGEGKKWRPMHQALRRRTKRKKS